MDVVGCGGGRDELRGWVWIGWVASALSPLWIADQVRNDVTMLVHRFHPHPSPLPSRERGFGWCCLVIARTPCPSGLRIKSAMT